MLDISLNNGSVTITTETGIRDFDSSDNVSYHIKYNGNIRMRIKHWIYEIDYADFTIGGEQPASAAAARAALRVLFLSAGGAASTTLTRVDTYNDLPDPTEHSGEYYFVENSQGTAWLPGTMGGTYYKAGLYYSTGLVWKSDKSPFQATLSDVISGVVTDQFVSPATLAGYMTNGISASNLLSGTIPDGRFPATLPAANGSNLTVLNASNLGSGTIPDARFPATLPAASGANLTALNASNLGSGTVPDARLQYVKGILGSSLPATNTIAGSTTNYISIHASAGNWNANENIRQFAIPVSGTVRSFYIALGGTQSGTGSLVLTVRKGGVDTSVVITIATNAVSGIYSDTSNSFTVAAGDLISIKGVNNASATSAPVVSVGCIITNY